MGLLKSLVHIPDNYFLQQRTRRGPFCLVTDNISAKIEIAVILFLLLIFM